MQGVKKSVNIRHTRVVKFIQIAYLTTSTVSETYNFPLSVISINAEAPVVCCAIRFLLFHFGRVPKRKRITRKGNTELFRAPVEGNVIAIDRGCLNNPLLIQQETKNEIKLTWHATF